MQQYCRRNLMAYRSVPKYKWRYSAHKSSVLTFMENKNLNITSDTLNITILNHFSSKRLQSTSDLWPLTQESMYYDQERGKQSWVSFPDALKTKDLLESYLTLVKPTFSYTRQFWCPNHRKDIDSLEYTHWKMTKIIEGLEICIKW